MSFFLASIFCLMMISTVMPRNVVEMEASKEEIQDKVIQEVLQELMKPSSHEKMAVVNGFSWSNCGSSSDWVQVEKLSIAPDPLSFPTTLTVAGAFNITHDLTAELTLKLVVKKEVLGIYIEIPCVDNFGSCEYDNVCEMLQSIQSQCPPELEKEGIECKCPIEKKAYTIAPASFQVGKVPIPSGEYEIEATLKKGNTEAACLKINLKVTE